MLVNSGYIIYQDSFAEDCLFLKQFQSIFYVVQSVSSRSFTKPLHLSGASMSENAICHRYMTNSRGTTIPQEQPETIPLIIVKLTTCMISNHSERNMLPHLSVTNAPLLKKVYKIPAPGRISTSNIQSLLTRTRSHV